MAAIWGHGTAASQRVALPKLAAGRRSAPHAVSEAGGSLLLAGSLLAASHRPAMRTENHRTRGMNASKLLFVRKIDFKASAFCAFAHFLEVGKCLKTFCHDVRDVSPQARPSSGDQWSIM